MGDDLTPAEHDLFAAMLRDLTPDERRMLTAVADQIEALPPDRRQAFSERFLTFIKNRRTN